MWISVLKSSQAINGVNVEPITSVSEISVSDIMVDNAEWDHWNVAF
jgi:hypothetical protein